MFHLGQWAKSYQQVHLIKKLQNNDLVVSLNSGLKFDWQGAKLFHMCLILAFVQWSETFNEDKKAKTEEDL